MLTYLEALHALAETGTMGEAAIKLRLTQSAISKRIRALEVEIGSDLIRRVGRRVELTEAGRQDPVLSAFAATQRVFQWHEDGIHLPPGAEHLASSPASQVQAFRYGEHAYGFQFHLEVTRFVRRPGRILPISRP